MKGFTWVEKRACIVIDDSKGKSHFKGFYADGIIASEVETFGHTESEFSKVLGLLEKLEKENNQKSYILFENIRAYYKLLKHTEKKSKMEL